MEDANYTFYAGILDGKDYTFFNTLGEALSYFEMLMDEGNYESYTIETVYGIKDLIHRYGAFDDYSDGWMEIVLENTTNMIRQQKKTRTKLQDNGKNSQTEKAE